MVAVKSFHYMQAQIQCFIYKSYQVMASLHRSRILSKTVVSLDYSEQFNTGTCVFQMVRKGSNKAELVSIIIPYYSNKKDSHKEEEKEQRKTQRRKEKDKINL